jgi:hypothetical protein
VETAKSELAECILLKLSEKGENNEKGRNRDSEVIEGREFESGVLLLLNG